MSIFPIHNTLYCSYSHCIRQAAGYCCVEYSTCTDSVDQFSLDNEAAAGSEVSMVGVECETVADGNTVSSGDYIVIEGKLIENLSIALT